MKEITVEQLKAFFGNNAEYYYTRWQLCHEGRPITFKPWAFLFGIFWFLYRKMYFESLVIFLVLILQGALLQAFGIVNYSPNPRTLDVVLGLINGTVMGVLGNYLYIKHTERKIVAILQYNPTQAELNDEIERQGGTSIVPVLIGIGILFAWIVLTTGA
jgi:hypothetical protein